MSCSEKMPFGEKEQATDLLMSEKFLAGTYNSYLLESATPEVLRCLDELLRREMTSRGWYPITKAQDTKLESEKQKFASKVSQ